MARLSPAEPKSAIGAGRSAYGAAPSADLFGGERMLQPGKRPTIASRHGMVAAAHPLAAATGARVLGNGGNAFDAAVATAATLNVVEPYMSGLAGLGMATCYIASEKRVRSLNFMSRIPAQFPLEKLSNREQIVRGP